MVCTETRNASFFVSMAQIVRAISLARAIATSILVLRAIMRAHHDFVWIDFRSRQFRRDITLICPLLSGPETMIVWTTKGTTDAIQEAQAGRYHRQAA